MNACLFASLLPQSSSTSPGRHHPIGPGFVSGGDTCHAFNGRSERSPIVGLQRHSALGLGHAPLDHGWEGMLSERGAGFRVVRRQSTTSMFPLKHMRYGGESGIQRPETHQEFPVETACLSLHVNRGVTTTERRLYHLSDGCCIASSCG